MTVPGISKFLVRVKLPLLLPPLLLRRFSRVRLFATLWTIAQLVSSVHGILQARILNRPNPGDCTCISYISCIARQVLYHESHLGSPQAPYPMGTIITRARVEILVSSCLLSLSESASRPGVVV